MLDRIHLQLLAALAAHGTVGRAAASLHISPSAASHRLADATRLVGVALTRQVGRTVELTAAGQHLADVSTSVEDELDQAALRAQWIGRGERDRVRVAVGAYDTVGWYGEVFEDRPGATLVELIRVAGDEPQVAARERRAELAVGVEPAHVRLSSDARSLADDHLVVVAAPGDGSPHGHVRVEDLVHSTYFTSSRRPRRGFEFSELFARGQALPAAVVQVQSVRAILALVAAGRGITIQPALAVRWSDAPHAVSTTPLAGAPIRVRWVMTIADGAGDEVAEVADRLVAAFATAAAS